MTAMYPKNTSKPTAQTYVPVYMYTPHQQLTQSWQLLYVHDPYKLLEFMNFFTNSATATSDQPIPTSIEDSIPQYPAEFEQDPQAMFPEDLPTHVINAHTARQSVEVEDESLSIDDTTVEDNLNLSDILLEPAMFIQPSQEPSKNITD